MKKGKNFPTPPSALASTENPEASVLAGHGEKS